MAHTSNPFVDYLSRYTTASPDHEAAFDEFLAQAPPPAGGPLRLATRVEDFLRACFDKPNPPSVILTGNAGDGKTYLCRQVVTAFIGQMVADWDAFAAQPIEHDTLRLHVVKDLSELGEAQGTKVLHGLAATLANQAAGERYLIAANEGRLRYLLGKHTDQALTAQMDRQLRDGPDLTNQQIIVINLTKVTTSSFVLEALRWMTQPVHWDTCSACPIRAHCPLHLNALRLRDPYIAGRVQLLYQMLEQLDIHVTVRDMLIHLAYSITGNQRCEQLRKREEHHESVAVFAYYENMWGRADDAAFQRKSSVVQHLGRLHIGDHSLFDVDDFIVSGGQTEAERAEHQRLFAPMIDLNYRQFAQDREAYLSGGADRTAADEEQALMEWLPHCRRKLFFEWHAEEKIDQLIPFLYFDLYQSLLRDERGVERGVREQALRALITGLNRAFSQLYLTEKEYLFVTTQYLHSGEQPRPLVRLRFPLTDMRLETVDLRTEAYNRDRSMLRLVIAPPAQFREAATAQQIQPVRWPIGLLQFEYLLRLAHGGTYNILAEECELDIRSLKDRLLTTFASTPQDDHIEFFVAERHRYSLKKLWIDDNDTFRG